MRIEFAMPMIVMTGGFVTVMIIVLGLFFLMAMAMVVVVVLGLFFVVIMVVIVMLGLFLPLYGVLELSVEVGYCH